MLGLWIVLQGVLAFQWHNRDVPVSEFAGGLIANVFMLIVVYVVLVWLVLILPTWKTHRAMIVHRDQAIRPFVEAVNVSLQKPGDITTERTRELESLTSGLDAAFAQYPTMPFPTGYLRVIGASTVIPPTLGVLGLVFQIISRT